MLFDAAVVVRPTHAVALMNLAAVASRQGDFPRAYALAVRAVDAEPLRATAHLAAGRYAIQLQDPAAARGHLGRALELDPASAPALALLAVLDLNAGDTERGLAHLRAALRAYSLDDDARRLRAQLDKRGMPLE